ncbi:hypothetical protein [Halobacterium rubrum]|uniref:hypothetical protein n=1 Tax=Halobacterium TaxID=2239 RepID=UPI001F42F494|nr:MULTISPECIES: hypothetical protein [Halobacterium]MDH5020558.1 hypothetical protein [Halobacterium rubrum]
MTRRVAALACALLLVTAGCAGIGGSDDQPTTAPTQTTAETTEATTTETAEQLAPGVTADGVEDPRALADAHRDALEGDAFVRRAGTRLTNESTTRTRNTTQQFTTDSLWRSTVSGEGVPVAFSVTNGSYDLYADGERVLWQRENDTAGNTSYGVISVTIRGDEQPVPPNQVFENNNFQRFYGHSLVYSLVANADSVEAVDDKAAAVGLSGTASELPTLFDRTGDVEFTMTVTAEGRATAIDLLYRSGDATVERTITFDTDVVNPVEEPDWYETALNETVANESAE